MSAVGARVTSFFLAPAPVAAPGTPATDGSPRSTSTPRSRKRTRTRTGSTGPRGDRAASRPDEGARAVAVVGGGEAVQLAHALAAALAARRRRRSTGVVCVWDASASPGPPLREPAAGDRVAAALTPVAGVQVTVAGRGLRVQLPADPVAAVAAHRDCLYAVEQAAAVVLAVCGPRPPCFDDVLAGQDHVVLALPTGAPTGLAGLAAASLEQLAGADRVSTVMAASAGGPLPRALRHRAPVRKILKATP